MSFTQYVRNIIWRMETRGNEGMVFFTETNNTGNYLVNFFDAIGSFACMETLGKGKFVFFSQKQNIRETT